MRVLPIKVKPMLQFGAVVMDSKAQITALELFHTFSIALCTIYSQWLVPVLPAVISTPTAPDKKAHVLNMHQGT